MTDPIESRYRGSPPRIRFLTPSSVLLGVLASIVVQSSLASDETLNEATAGIRGELEAQFQAATGLGFQAFDCEFPQGWPTSREILCEAVDEEGDRFFYQLTRVEGQNEPRMSMRQPVDQLNPDGLAVLRRPTDAFLSAFMADDWDAVLASLEQSFEAQLGVDGLRSILAPIKASFGSVSNPRATFYATPSEGLHQLDYALTTSAGVAVGRFRLRFDAGGNPQIVSFFVNAAPGTALHASLLEGMGKSVLDQFFDQPIERIEGPMDRVLHIGESEEVNLVLADGSSVRARMEQTGSTWDMDSNDYRFQVLDARTLIGLHLASSGQRATSIECPNEVAPDGGSLDCEVTVADGSSTTFRLMRRGGEHRLVPAD